jgi:hypothetical protein
MRAVAHAAAIVTLLASILATLSWGIVFTHPISLDPRQIPFPVLIFFIGVISSIFWMVFSGWVNRYPWLALTVFVAILPFFGFCFLLWWFAGGACDYEYWLHGQAVCM